VQASEFISSRKKCQPDGVIADSVLNIQDILVPLKLGGRSTWMADKSYAQRLDKMGLENS
jgi:hypothetical protein